MSFLEQHKCIGQNNLWVKLFYGSKMKDKLVLWLKDKKTKWLKKCGLTHFVFGNISWLIKLLVHENNSEKKIYWFKEKEKILSETCFGQTYF